MHLSLRRALVAALLGAALLGSAALAGGQVTSAPAPTAATHLSPSRGTCPKGSVLTSAPNLANAPVSCEPIGQPETFADLAALTSSYDTRLTAPFNTVKPGAYQAAIAQKAAAAPAGSAPGSGGAWTPYGKAPECANPSTVAGGPCPAASAANGSYTNVGPLGFHELSGRISAFAYDPTHPGRFFASPTAGGVFETTDAAATWHSVGDGLPTQVVGGIAYDIPLHRILVGTGDNSSGGSGISGHGFYYSSDDGVTWLASTGIPDNSTTFRVVASPADATGNTVYVALDHGLFRSTDGGASFVNEKLPTTPAGYTPNCAGDTTTPMCFFASMVSDVVVKSTSSANAPAGAVMAVVGWRAGPKPYLLPDGSSNMSCKLNGTPTACIQAPQDGVYISTTGAPGTFTYSDQSATSTGFAPASIAGRTALGIAHGAGQDNDAVYALVEDASKFKGCMDVLDTATPACQATVVATVVATVLDGLYASYDFGKSWTKIMDYTQTKYPNTNSSLLGVPAYSPGVQAWYNLWVEPDPSVSDSNGDPQRVAFGLEEIWENNQTFTLGSTPNPILHQAYTAQPPPGPATDPWVVIGRYWNGCSELSGAICNSNLQNNPLPGSTTHPDQHAALFVPDGKGGVTLYAGSDGGVFSQHVASGSDFTNDSWGDGDNVGLYTLQPYDAEMAKDGTVVAGLQDNGEEKIVPSGAQAEIFGGDAFFSAIDPGNSQNIIEEYTYAAASLSNDGGATWYSISPANCASTTSLFSTPMEQDPTTPGHVVLGCTQVQEATNAYANPCSPVALPASQCQNTASPFATVFDLSTINGAPDSNCGATVNADTGPLCPIPSAVGVRGANIYIGFCGYCDVLGGQTFHSGIATNVGGSAPPKIGTANGWHFAAGNCANCGTPDGKLPQRYINSVQMDPSDPNTVYVTMGGYERPWIPPGAIGDATAHVGNGHVFVSHDAGATFTDISGNLPDTPAFWTLLHNGNLVVATNIGVFESTGPNGGNFGVLGTGLPAAPVFTLRLSPSNPNVMIAATYGRGVQQYTFTDAPVNVPEVMLAPLLPVGGAALFGVVLWKRRRRRAAASASTC